MVQVADVANGQVDLTVPAAVDERPRGLAAKVRAALDYGKILAITAMAPLFWSIYSIIAKPIMARSSPLVFTYLAISIGSVPLLAMFPWKGREELAQMPVDGWAAVLYLSLLCTFGGYAAWTWLLRHLPASSVGFTVFLNPPLTTISKWAAATLAPATFVFAIRTEEWWGGALTLLGLWIALVPGRGGSSTRRDSGNTSSVQETSRNLL